MRANPVGLAAASLLLAGAAACSGSAATPPGARLPSPTFTPGRTSATLMLATPRAVHRATVLDDGRVLITGGCTLPGCDGFDAGRTSEIFDPASGRFRIGGRTLKPRA